MSTDTVTAPEVTENSAGNSADTVKETPEQILARLEVDETDARLYAKTETAIASYNSHVTELKSLSGDVDEVADSIRQSDDPEIVSLRERAEKAKAAFDKAQATLDESAKAKAQAKIAENTDQEKVDTLKAQVEKETKRIKATMNMLKAEYGDDILAAFTALVGNKGSGAATGRGAGVARPRNFTVSVDGKVATMPNNNKEEVSSFSAAAKVLGIPTADVQAKYFESEGSDANGWTPGKPVSFTLKGADGKDHTVVATKNRDAK
jgi:hypothetical protein